MADSNPSDDFALTEELDAAIESAAELVSTARHVVALTGAGDPVVHDVPGSCEALGVGHGRECAQKISRQLHGGLTVGGRMWINNSDRKD